jgi:hypothetical protein
MRLDTAKVKFAQRRRRDLFIESSLKNDKLRRSGLFSKEVAPTGLEISLRMFL